MYKRQISYRASASGTFGDGIRIWSGSGNDTFVVDGTHLRSSVAALTWLNTGLGNDRLTVDLRTGQDGLLVLNTQGPDDNVLDLGARGINLVDGDGPLDADRVTRAEAWQLFSVALSTAGLALVTKGTTIKIVEIDTNGLPELEGNKASFLPTKEILSIFDAIVATRETMELAAFDDTYYDLVQDYRQPTTKGKLQVNIAQVFKHLEDVTGGGEIELEKDGNIVFRRGKEVFNMHQTAEGIKKITEITQRERVIANDWLLAMTGYRPDYACLEALGVAVRDDDARTPVYDETTFETNRQLRPRSL